MEKAKKAYRTRRLDERNARERDECKYPSVTGMPVTIRPTLGGRLFVLSKLRSISVNGEFAQESRRERALSQIW